MKKTEQEKLPTKRKFLRRLIRTVFTVLILILLLFLGSNLFLASSAGEKFILKNLSRRAPGIQWQVSGANWSPWQGITVKELSAELTLPPEITAEVPPLFVLQEVNLKPYWGQLIRGKKLFREIVIEEPVLNIPIELLVITPPSKPQTSSNPQPPKPKKPGSEAQPKPKPKAAPKTQQKAKPKPKPITKEPLPAPDEKRFWLRLRKAKIRLHSLKLDQTIEIENLDLDLPLAGPKTKGEITWQQITLAGQSLCESTTLPIEWDFPTWTLPNQKIALTLPQLMDPSLPAIPLQLNLAGSFSPRTKNRDFRLVTTIPSQPIADYLLHQRSDFHLQCPDFSVSFNSRGALLSPKSWRFNSSLSMNEPEVFSGIRGPHIPFDTLRARLILQNSTLITPTLSLRSERLSMMGNGQLHLGGYLLGVLRIVADPEISERFTNIAIGSHISQGWTSGWLYPLETPDRYYRDLHFEGFLPNPTVNTGRKGEQLPLTQILRLLQYFTKNEVAEEINKSP